MRPSAPSKTKTIIYSWMFMRETETFISRCAKRSLTGRRVSVTLASWNGLSGPARTVLAGSSGKATTCSKRLRSEEHTSELQSRFDLVCRLLLEKKKSRYKIPLLNDKSSKRRTSAPQCLLH